MLWKLWAPINETDVQFLNDLGHRITSVSVDNKEGQFLFQRLSIALQRFNAILLIIFIHQLDGRLNIIMKVNLTNYNHAVHKVKHKARHALVDKREHKTTTPYIT